MSLSRRLLILDDDNEYRKSVISLFEGEGLEFLEAGTVRAALKQLEANPDIQVLILDLKLAHGQGTALLDAIKDRVENYRVIVLTAHNELLAAREAEAYKVFSYVTKADQSSFREALLFNINAAFTDLENAWLGKKIKAHLEIVRRVNLLGLVTNQTGEEQLRDVLERICDYALDLLGAYTCHIRIVDPGRGDFVLWAARGINNIEAIFESRVPLSRAYSGIAAETKGVIIEGNVQKQDAFQAMKAEALAGNPDRDAREYWERVRCIYVIPISTGVFGNEIDSVFNVNSDAEDFFIRDDRRELVNDFVSLTDLAITKYLLKKKRHDIHDDYRNIGDMLAEISNVFIAGEDELEQIYKIVFQRISQGLGPEIISIFRYDDASLQLRNVAEYRGDVWVGPVDESYSPGVGLVGRVYSDGNTMVFAKRDDSQDDLLPEGYVEENIKNIPSGRLLHYLAVPIKFGSDIIGVIRAVNKKSEQYNLEKEKTNSICLLKRGFSEDCRTELEIAANHLAATIKNAELIGELNKTVNQLESLYAVSHMISYGKDMNAAFNLIVQSAAQAMHAEICMLFLMTEKKDGVELTQCFGMPRIEGASYKLGEGKTGTVAKTGEPILEKHAAGNHVGKYDEEILTFLRAKHDSPSKSIESFMAVPIIAEGKRAGVIKLINKLEPPFHFDHKDLELFKLYASQIAGLERFLDAQRFSEKFIENSPQPIIFLDGDGHITRFNKACENLWQYSLDEVRGKLITGFYASERHARDIGKRLWKAQGNRIHSIDTEIKDKFGTLIPVRLSAAFLLDDGKRTGSFGIFDDLRQIQQLQDLQDKYLRSEREALTGKLAHTMGHDIKHNIGTVLNYLETLQFECDQKEQQELYQIYTDMQEALQEAVAQLKNVLDAVHPTPPRKSIVRLKDVFTEDIRRQMKRQAELKDVDFQFECPNDELELSIDVKQIEVVLWNLFDNSRDAIMRKRDDGVMIGRGRIDASASIENGSLEIRWRDNGCGISNDKEGIVFQPFYTDKPSGNGLGLYILKNNVEAHGGEVLLQSVVGEGTTFTLRIPVSTD